MPRTLVSVDKRQLRRQMKSLGEPGPDVLAEVVEHLFRWMAARLPGTVSAYLAMTEEVPVEPLFDRLPGWRWVLPRVEGDGSLTLRDRDLPRERHPWGMDQPVGRGEPVPVHQVDLILVPGLAFDRSGRRLGRGKGYYDRLLAERRNDCLAVGVTTGQRLIDQVPTEHHDVAVEFVVTEAGLRPVDRRIPDRYDR